MEQDISEKRTKTDSKSSSVIAEIKKFFTILFSIVGIFLLIVVIGFSSGSDNQAPTVTEEPRREDYSELDSEAYIVSQRYIEAILKSPSTADFPFMDFTATHLGNGRYRVTSYVDSKNSFGAMIRSDWTVLMTYKSGDSINPSSWELEEVVFDGEVMYP